MWHSCLAKLEVDAQDLEKPEEVAAIAERLAQVQQLHSQLAKQAELRTALIGKVRTETWFGKRLPAWKLTPVCSCSDQPVAPGAPGDD